ncbi:MAG TPA: hypothetical protein PKX38_05145 [Alphaproteobacteria bacterium]|nr:hypothetical protein [Micavibrio sp.]MBK9562964.1 hypothetical protein [Micavibrio sp.]HQX27307.1 hypothetical protein [Alphaproteobacteria bacterium]
MGFEVITNPSFVAKTGFTQGQFKKLDDLYCRAASAKILTYRTVECDFDEGVASYTYYKTQSESPYLQFVLRKVGPRDMMYEIFKQSEGRIYKSGIFESAYVALREKIEGLFKDA